MPLVRKRRAEPQESQRDDNDSSAASDEEITQRQRLRQRLRTDENHDNNAEGESAAESNPSDSDDDSQETRAPSTTDVMVKKLVRLALASEYSRQAIRRTDISAKVLGEQGQAARQFKVVFEAAQRALRIRFGMEMVELPVKEKVTVSQRRAAQKVEKPSSSNKSWILTSTLPPAYRTPTILPPTKAPSSSTESTYTALYTFIIAVILLNGGTLPEQKLDRYLKRTNTDTYTPIDRTDRFLQRLCKEGYLVRNREMDGGEELVEYMVGPRGKVEVGEKGVAGLVREVFGRQAAVDGAEDLTGIERDQMEEFERRLQRSLGIRARPQQTGVDEPAGVNGVDRSGDEEENGPRRRRSRRQAARGSGSDDSD